MIKNNGHNIILYANCGVAVSVLYWSERFID